MSRFRPDSVIDVQIPQILSRFCYWRSDSAIDVQISSRFRDWRPDLVNDVQSIGLRYNRISIIGGCAAAGFDLILTLPRILLYCCEDFMYERLMIFKSGWPELLILLPSIHAVHVAIHVIFHAVLSPSFLIASPSICFTPYYHLSHFFRKASHSKKGAVNRPCLKKNAKKTKMRLFKRGGFDW